jgi:uncharacterized protein
VIINVAPLLKQMVGTQADYRIDEDPIDPHGENSGLLDAGAKSIEADITATHTNLGALLEGEARATVELQCARCLRPTLEPVKAEFAEQYYAEVGLVSGEPLDKAPEGAKTIGSDFRIDLTPLLCEELILATPQVVLHSPDCKGLCLVCGEDLNARPHEHDEPIDARWAKLQELRDFHAERD